MAGPSDCNNHRTNREPDQDELRRLLTLARAGSSAQLSDDEQDPELLTAARRQQRVAAVLQSGGPATPEQLRERIDRLYEGQPTPRSARLGAFAPGWWRWAAAAGAVVAAVLVVAVVLVTGGSSTRPAASRVAQVWTLPATSGEVAANAGNPAELG